MSASSNTQDSQGTQNTNIESYPTPEIDPGVPTVSQSHQAALPDTSELSTSSTSASGFIQLYLPSLSDLSASNIPTPSTAFSIPVAANPATNLSEVATETAASRDGMIPNIDTNHRLIIQLLFWILEKMDQEREERRAERRADIEERRAEREERRVEREERKAETEKTKIEIAKLKVEIEEIKARTAAINLETEAARIRYRAEADSRREEMKQKMERSNIEAKEEIRCMCGRLIPTPSKETASEETTTPAAVASSLSRPNEELVATSSSSPENEHIPNTDRRSPEYDTHNADSSLPYLKEWSAHHD